jgi:hypothetical protein
MFILKQDNYLELLNQYKKDKNCSNLSITIVGELLEETDQYFGFWCFERIGLEEDANNENIRLLTKNDSERILGFCYKLSKQGHFSRCEADSLKDYIEYIDDNLSKLSRV